MKDALEVLNLIHHSADPVRSLIGRLNLLCKLDKFEVKSDLNMLFSAFFSVYTQYLPFFEIIFINPWRLIMGRGSGLA